MQKRKEKLKKRKEKKGKTIDKESWVRSLHLRKTQTLSSPPSPRFSLLLFQKTKAAGLIQPDANRFWLFPGNLAHAACVTALSLKASALCSSLSPTSLPGPRVCTRSAEGGQSSLEEGWSKPSGCLGKNSTLRHGEEATSFNLQPFFSLSLIEKLLNGSEEIW